MSTLATTNIKQPDSVTNNITLTSGGDTTISGNTTVSGNATVTGTPTLGGLTYPTADGTAGQVLTTNGSGTLSFASPFTYGTAHTFDNTTNEKTFTGIPSTAKRITMMVQGVSAASLANTQILVRVGTSAGLNTSSIYRWNVSYINLSEYNLTDTNWRLVHSNFNDAANEVDGIIELVKLSTTGNKWVFSAQLGMPSGGQMNNSAGSIDLGSGVLDRIQLLHGSAINYDAGTVNIMYES